MKKTAFVLSVLAIAASCTSNQSGEKEKEAVEIPTPAVEVCTVSKQSVPQDQVYSTTVQAFAINNIAPQSASRIQKINVEVGDYVGAGQVVAEMDRVQLDQASLRLKNAEDELGRLQGLYEEGGVSQSDFESVQLSCKVTRSSYDNLYENTVLKSPISGVVSARNYDRGDMYMMGQPIFTIQQITPVKILVPVSESDYTRVKKGDTVTLTADAIPGKEFSGSVVRLYPTMDPATHTFSVEVRVANSDRLLRPGMYARVKVNFGDTFNPVVPDAAVVKQQGSGQRSVYVVDKDSVVTLTNVTLGRHFDGNYEILSGLEGGETVVVKGQSALKSGIKVEVR